MKNVDKLFEKEQGIWTAEEIALDYLDENGKNKSTKEFIELDKAITKKEHKKLMKAKEELITAVLNDKHEQIIKDFKVKFSKESYKKFQYVVLNDAIDKLKQLHNDKITEIFKAIEDLINKEQSFHKNDKRFRKYEVDVANVMGKVIALKYFKREFEKIKQKYEMK